MRTTLVLMTLAALVVAQYDSSTSTSTDAGTSSSSSSSSDTPSALYYSDSSTSSSSTSSTSPTSSDATNTTVGGNSTSAYYTTIFEYTDICTSNGVASTATGVSTAYVCHQCNGGKGNTGVLTTYTTVYNSVCPTGSTLSPVTYTVTEPCPEVGKPLPAGHMPQGFAATMAPCSCPNGSAIITAPTAAPATPVPTEGAPATAAPLPATTVPLALASAPASNNTCVGPQCRTPSAPVQPGAGNRPVVFGLNALTAAIVAFVCLL